MVGSLPPACGAHPPTLTIGDARAQAHQPTPRIPFQCALPVLDGFEFVSAELVGANGSLPS
jgi:hypothetical protein